MWTFRPTVQFVVPVVVVAVAAWLFDSSSGLIGFVLGVTALSSSAVGAARVAETVVLGVLAAVFAGLTVVLPDHPAAAATAVALAALSSAPFNQRSNGTGVALPVLVAVLAVLDIETAATTAAWVFLGAVVVTVLAHALGLRRPLSPTARSAAWRHAVLTAAIAGPASWAVVSWEVPHGYWAVATVCVVLRPVADETMRASRDRISATFAGALMAGLIAVLLPVWAAAVSALACIFLMLGWLIVADQRRYTTFLTPVVVLTAAAGSAPVLTLATERIILSAVGVALAAAIAIGLRKYERGLSHEQPDR